MNAINRLPPPEEPLMLPPPDWARKDATEKNPGGDRGGDAREEREGRGDGEEPPRPPRRWPFLLAGVAVLLALGWGGWRHWQTSREAASTQQQARDFKPRLRVAEAKREDGTVALRLPGQLSAFDQARLYARATGYVAERRVDIGSRVRKGDLLLRVSAPDLDAQLRQAAAQVGQMQAQVVQANANVESARSNVDLARATNARTTTLAAQGWETRQNADNTRANVQSGGSNLDAAQAGVKVAEANLKAQLATVQRLQELVAFEQVVAPFDGVITSRAVDAGDLINADAGGGTPLFAIARDDVVRVQISVPQSGAIGLRDGLDAKVTVPELPGRNFAGKVARSAVALDPATRTMAVEVDVPNPDGLLHPGLYVDVEIGIPRTAPAVVVPAEAIVFDAEGLRVLTVANGRVHVQKVTVYRDFGTSVELRDGLKGGEQVALSPPTGLQDGAEIQVEQPPRQDGGDGTQGQQGKKTS